MHLGIYDHFGWAVAVVASPDRDVVERRRLELVEPGVTAAPIHYERDHHDDHSNAALVATVRASVVRASAAAFDALASSTTGSIIGPIRSCSLRSWPSDFPTDIATLRRPPYESRADAIMYRQVLADLARRRGWDVYQFDAKHVVEQAATILGARADDVLDGPRRRLGPPWTRDHRIALAATVVAGAHLTP